MFRRNTEKYITFSVPIKKEHYNGKTIAYKLKFVDSYRFMQDSLSRLDDNLSDINNKEPENKFMTDSLSQSNNNPSQMDKKESKDKFIDNIRSMMTSLSQSINKQIMQIDRKN